MVNPQGGLLLEPLRAAFASKKSQLIEAFVFLLLLPDAKPHRSFIPPDCGHRVSPCPKVLPDKVSSFAPMCPRDGDRTHALQV